MCFSNAFLGRTLRVTLTKVRVTLCVRKSKSGGSRPLKSSFVGGNSMADVAKMLRIFTGHQVKLTLHPPLNLSLSCFCYYTFPHKEFMEIAMEFDETSTSNAEYQEKYVLF